MKSHIAIACLSLLIVGATIPCQAVPLILNEFNAVGGAKFLDTNSYAGSLKEDSYFRTIPGLADGRIQGNGGDWIELVVVEDHVDIRGWSLHWEEDFFNGQSTAQGRRGGAITFSPTAPIWSNLRRGTILTISELASIGVDTDLVGADRNRTAGVDPAEVDVTIALATDISFDPLAGDWWIHVSTRYEADQANPLVTTTFDNPPNYEGEPSSPGDFSVTNDNWQLSIHDAQGGLVFGPIGEDTDGWWGSGINSNEVGKLEENPTNMISDQGISKYNDGSSSSFGQPNIWTEGGIEYTQDFESLRAGLTFPLMGDFNGDGLVDAADYTVWRNNLDASESILNGAGDNSGIVDIGDYELWKANFGASSQVDWHLTSHAVPEPRGAAAALLIVATVVFGHLAYQQSGRGRVATCGVPDKTVQRRRGFTLVELLVVIAILGVLVALLLPAVQSAREAARRTQCGNNLKQIGLGILNYESTTKRFPHGQERFVEREKPFSWSVLTLPYMEQSALYDQIDFKQPLDSTRNKGTAAAPGPVTMLIDMYLCPSRQRIHPTREQDNRIGDLDNDGDRYDDGKSDGMACIDYLGL